MRLRTVFFIYVLSTAAAVAAPYVMTAVENAQRKTISVNSESPLESAPVLQPRSLWGEAAPACIALDGTIYHKNGMQSDWRDPGRTLRPFARGNKEEFDSCAVSRDGTVYAIGQNRNRLWQLSSYKPSGDLNWSIPTLELCSRPALDGNGIVYLVSREKRGTTILTAFRPDGSHLWETPIGGTGWYLTAPAIAANGDMYLAAASFTAPAQLVAISSKGRELWRIAVPHMMAGNGNGPIIGEDGRIFVQVAKGAAAFNEHGEKLWEFTSGNQDTDGGIALGGDGILYVASRFLYALDKSGKPEWIFKSERTYTDRDDFSHHPLIAKDGTIYANSYYEQLYAITPDGRKKWVVNGEPTVMERAWGQPILTQGGTLVTNAGWFAVSSGLATAGWPTENHDNSNSRHQEKP